MLKKFELNRREIQDLFVEWLYVNNFDEYGFYRNLKHKNVTDRGGFENETFLINPYYWGEDEEIQDEPNFVFKPLGIEIEWYKYPMRSAYSNVKITAEHLKDILEKCRLSIED